MEYMDKNRDKNEVEGAEGKETVLPEAGEVEEVPGEEAGGGDAPLPSSSGQGFLELVYGVLFDPVNTFKKVAAAPPLGQAILIYFLLNLLSSAMGSFVNTGNLSASMAGLPPGFIQAIQGLVPLLIFGGLIFQFIKWFFYSGVLHLIADLYGGAGTARGVFAVYGLAALPGFFVIPFQLLGLTGISGTWLFNLLIAVVSIALYIWGVILLILGIKEVHGITGGKAVGVVFTPVLVFIALGIAALIAVFSIISTLPQNIPGFPI